MPDATQSHPAAEAPPWIRPCWRYVCQWTRALAPSKNSSKKKRPSSSHWPLPSASGSVQSRPSHSRVTPEGCRQSGTGGRGFTWPDWLSEDGDPAQETQHSVTEEASKENVWAALRWRAGATFEQGPAAGVRQVAEMAPAQLSDVALSCDRCLSLLDLRRYFSKNV